MATDRALRISITGTPAVARLTRSDSVPDDLWFSIPINLGPGVTGDRAGTHLDVPIDRLLAGRRWLAVACRRHDVAVSADDRARELLERAQSERAAVLRRIDMPRRAAPSSSSIDLGQRFIRQLMPFQERDLSQLLELEHGANFSVPGAGKTTVTYALHGAELRRGRVDQLVVVAPLSAFEAWEREVVECFSEPPRIVRFGVDGVEGDVVLLNYQRLSQARTELTQLMLDRQVHLVLDEAHRMKRGRLGEWGDICLSLAPLAVRRDILTGTPAPQSPRDFIALTDFLWPGQARLILPAEALRTDPPDDAMDRVNSAITPLFVRTTKSELGLTEPTIRAELVEQGPLQEQIYDALRNRYGGMFDMSRRDAGMLAQMGEVTMYLLEAATNPALLLRASSEGDIPLRYPPLAIPAGSQLADLIRDYAHHEVPPKLVKLATLVGECVRFGRKVLIWSNFVGNLLRLEQMFGRYRPALVYGGIPSESSVEDPSARTRESELSRFRSDDRCRVLLANPAATAEGISLHDVCHDAIYLERTFNAGQYLQSIDRIHRLGLAPGEATRITFLITRGTIDETVDARVGLKAQRLSQMLDDPDLVRMALPDDEDYGEVLDDVGDLEALFDHLAATDE